MGAVNRSGTFGQRLGEEGGALQTLTDAQIIATSESDPSRFGEIFDRHFPAIHRYVHRRVGRQLADDLAAETFSVAFRNRGTVRPDPRGRRSVALRDRREPVAGPPARRTAAAPRVRQDRGGSRPGRRLRCRGCTARCELRRPGRRPGAGSVEARRSRDAAPVRVGGPVVPGDRRRAHHPDRHGALPPPPGAAAGPRDPRRERLLSLPQPHPDART